MARFTSGARSLTQGERYMMHYNSARGNMLLAIIFTVVNSLLACIGGNMYFLFSITFPYAMVSEGAFWTGLMGTPEQYAEYGYTEADMMPMWFLAVMIVPALVALGVYLLCWIFSKKHVGWMIAATVAFVLDTLFLIVWYGVDVTMLLDYLFHGWALFLFIRGCIAHFKLKELERERAERIFRFLTRNAAQVSPDAQGRIVLPQSLLSYASIEKTAMIVGCDSYAEIWSEEVYNAYVEEEDTDEVRADLAGVKFR